MNSRRFVDEISSNVNAYCEAIDVPNFDEAAIASRRHPVTHSIVRSHARLKMAVVAATVALVVVLCDIPAVVAGVQRVFAAFTIAAGQQKPMTIRAVDLERARADMPFVVIAPPPIAGAPIVGINEIYADNSASDASIIFEIHGPASVPDVMIIESKATSYHAPTLLTIRRPAGAAEMPQLHSLGLPAPSDGRAPKVALRGLVEGRAFAPIFWIVRGTRVVVMSPPGFLSSAQLQAIRRAMSR